METKKDKLIICNCICSILMVLLIVLQFIPYWNYGGQQGVVNDKPYESKKGQSISINSYVWGNPKNIDLMLYFSGKFDDCARVEEGDTQIEVPLEALNEKYGQSGIYVKNGNTIKYKVVEILSKNSESATIKVDTSKSKGLLLDDEVVIVNNEENLNEYTPAGKEIAGYEIPLEAISENDEKSRVYMITYAGVEILSGDTTHAVVKIDDTNLIEPDFDEIIVIHNDDEADTNIPVEKEVAAVKIPLEAIHEKDGVSGLYVKDGETAKYKQVDVISKDDKSAIVRIDNTEKNRLIPNDEVLVPYNETKLEDTFSHYLDIIGGITCWQLVLAIIGAAFCFVKKETGIFTLLPLVNGIYGAYFYRNSPALKLCSYWTVPFVINILMAVFALVTLFFWVKKIVQK